ncbi:hypothetical protein TorRG33x02_233180 [Trema orientale]|uniref:Uncharacterized protein n=1 Tax=Trema orientale TaxID=63057 RepID=A0A2P5E5Y8_TREOI|nr:hypothetical protein TorRG33x02_233180 [Trema orientale]
MNYLSPSQIHDNFLEVEGRPRFVDFFDESKHVAQVFVVGDVAGHYQLELELRLVKKEMDPRVMKLRMTMMDLKMMTMEVRMKDLRVMMKNLKS